MIAYLFKNQSKAFGWGIEASMGLMYRSNERWSFSAIHRSGAKLKLKGEMGFRHIALGLNNSTDFDQDFYQPATYGPGVAYKPTLELTLTFDWQQTDWATMKLKMDFDRDIPPIQRCG